MLDFSSPVRKVFRIKVPSYVYITTVTLLCGVIYFSLQKRAVPAFTGHEPTQIDNPSVRQFHQGGYELIKPFLFAETDAEDQSLQEIKSQLVSLINDNIKSGHLVNASIYLKKLDYARSIRINPAETYNPGSLMKLPVMIAYFKEAMNGTAAILDKKILFNGHNPDLPVEEGSVPLLKVGKSYSVKELIDYMIIDSDNDAMGLLVNNFDEKKLHKMFADLGVPIPGSNTEVFNITPEIYGRFLRILYNSTYLDRSYSQRALSILTQTKYRKGIVRNISDVKVAHKYGISVTNGIRSLSEAGVFYKDSPYLFVIMTKGSEYPKMADIISQCSDMVYKGMQ